MAIPTPATLHSPGPLRPAALPVPRVLAPPAPASLPVRLEQPLVEVRPALLGSLPALPGPQPATAAPEQARPAAAAVELDDPVSDTGADDPTPVAVRRDVRRLGRRPERRAPAHRRPRQAASPSRKVARSVMALLAVLACAAVLSGRAGDPGPRGTVAGPPPPAVHQTPEAAERDILSAASAQVHFFVDEGRFTDDLIALARFTEEEDVLWGTGVAPPRGRAVNVAVGEKGRLACLTTAAPQGVAVATLLIDGAKEYRTGSGPLASCDKASASKLRQVD